MLCSWQKITQLARTRLSSVMNEEMEVPFTVNRNQRKKWQRRKKSEEKFLFNKKYPTKFVSFFYFIFYSMLK